MIISFKDRRLERFFATGDRSRLNPAHVERIANILFMLDNVSRPEDLNLPGWRLHPLKGNLKGYWSITVRANWRITFRFDDADVLDVDLTDYH